MLSSQMLALNTHDDEIRQLHREISSYITTLDNSIRDGEDSYIVLQYKIDRWKDKKVVLEVALSCLSGEKNLTDLNSAILNHLHCFDKDMWWECDTEKFVKRVTTVLTQYSLAPPPPPPPSFLLSCVSNHFALLPCDIQLFLLVCHLYHSADVIHFASTSKSNYLFFQNNVAVTMLRPSLNHVALGEYHAAEQITLKDKTILTKKGTTSYHPGRYRYVNQTQYQIALRNEEWDEAEKMGKDLSHEEKQKQFDEIFPDGKLISYGCKLETATLLLEAVFNAIIVDNDINENDLDKMTTRTRDALQLLHDAINPENYNECQIGLVFDVRIYQEALNRYELNVAAFQTWGRRTFWCVRVEELIASCLSTGYLRPHCQGIYNINNGATLKDGCKLSDGSSYFSFCRKPNSLPGFHFFVNIAGVALPYAAHGTAFLKRWKNYVEQKQQAGRTYATIFADRKLCNSDFMK